MSQVGDKKPVKIWAHRGAIGYAPENTLEAFEAAVRVGADGIEAGVHAIITNYPDKAKRVAGYWTDGIRGAIPLTVGKLLGKEEQTEDEKKPFSEMSDKMRQHLFELFRSKYEALEAENKNAESDTGYIFTT